MDDTHKSNVTQAVGINGVTMGSQMRWAKSKQDKNCEKDNCVMTQTRMSRYKLRLLRVSDTQGPKSLIGRRQTVWWMYRPIRHQRSYSSLSARHTYEPRYCTLSLHIVHSDYPIERAVNLKGSYNIIVWQNVNSHHLYACIEQYNRVFTLQLELHWFWKVQFNLMIYIASV